MNTIKNKVKQKISPFRAALLATIITFVLCAFVFYIWSNQNNNPGHINNDKGSRSELTDKYTNLEQDQQDLYTCGMHPWIISEEPGNCPICGMKLTLKTTNQVSNDSSADPSQRKIVYWRAAMDPTEIYDAPGKSRMGMDLVPVYEDEVTGGVDVKIDPTTQQNMGIRTADVVVGPISRSVRTYGHITYDETKTYQYTSKFSGWIEKLYVDYTGQAVQKGEKLFEVYSPELVTAQEEFLAAYRLAKKSAGSQGDDLLKAATRRLSYWDIPAAQIKALKQNGIPSKTMTILSPYSGIVIQKNIEEGVFIKAGKNIFQISDLKHVWLEAHIFEYELPLIKIGQSAEMTLPYTPGIIYHGKVAYIYPYLEKQARDVVLRLEFDNKNMSLKPDMYANVVIHTESDKTGIIIPSESVIHSGPRNLVFISVGNGNFQAREVDLGLPLTNGRVQVLSGLAGNEVVVTSGQFLLDSESKLKEAVQKMLAAKRAELSTAATPTSTSTSASDSVEDDFFSDMDDMGASQQ